MNGERLDGKLAVVTAASQGIGAAVALRLAQAGAQVIIGARDEGALQGVVAKAATDGNGSVQYQRLDLLDATSVARFAEAIAQVAPDGIDMFVGNSGGPRPGEFTTLTWQDWVQAHQLLLGSHVILLQHFYPLLQRRQGNVVFIGSTAIRQPLPGLVLSNVYRTALASLVKTLSKEWGPQGVRVNMVSPGAILTNRLRRVHQGRAELFHTSVEEVREEERRRIALGRFGTAEEVAEAVLFLVSKGASFITGTSLTVDGGLNDML